MTDVLGSFSVSDLQVFYSIKILTSGQPCFHPVERQRGGTAGLWGAVLCPPAVRGCAVVEGHCSWQCDGREGRSGLDAFLLSSMVTPKCTGDGDEPQTLAAQGSRPSNNLWYKWLWNKSLGYKVAALCSFLVPFCLKGIPFSQAQVTGRSAPLPFP